MHTFEDRIIEMTASHDRFSVANVDGRHNVMGDLLSVKYGFLIPDLDFFGHLIDAKRDRNVVTVVATPFQRVCYSFINEDELNPLSVDAHITTSLCWSSLLLSLALTLLVLFFPDQFINGLILLTGILLTMVILLPVNSYLLPYSWYANYISVYLVLPILRVCSAVILLVVHTVIRGYDFFVYFYQRLVPIVVEYWNILIITLQKTSTQVSSFVASMVPTKDQIVQWILLHRMEIILTFFAILFTIYVFVPTKSNWTVPIRLICVMLLLAAIAFLDYMLAIRVFITCAIVGVLLLLIKSTLIDMWYSIKRIIARKNEKME
ncbi:hypothetical protein WA171_004422 [Blastocystis sp. BT1]